jgi:predicted nucleic acid-binding protein
MFARVILPAAVQNDPMDINAPVEVRNWNAHPPQWLEIDKTAGVSGPATLGRGETAVIALAELLRAALLLMDERKGVKIARGKGLRVTGTLGLLELAAQLGLVDFVDAIQRLRLMTFRAPDALLETMLQRHVRP